MAVSGQTREVCIEISKVKDMVPRVAAAAQAKKHYEFTYTTPITTRKPTFQKGFCCNIVEHKSRLLYKTPRMLTAQHEKNSQIVQRNETKKNNKKTNL